MIAVKHNMYNETPVELLGCGVSWAYSFSLGAIERAIENAESQE